jgi:[acyl-carrier-protein] S-malonyltransferase
VRTALLFPGQGSQYVGMGRDLVEAHPAARALFDEAGEILAEDLGRICFEGPEDLLRQTRNTQPAIFVHSLAVLKVLGWDPRGDDFRAAGHSLGEYTAYVAAGAISFADGLRLVRRRGELMYQAGLDRPGTMAAVLGLEGARVEEAVSGIAGTVRVANFNSPGQVVLSGEIDAVGLAMEACKQAGARKVIPLEVSGAFHSPLMESAAAGLSEMLARTPIARPGCVVLANATAQPVVEPEEIRASLQRQLLSPVRWEQTMRGLIEWGAERFVELGPGKVLCGLVRALDKEARTIAVGDAAQIAALREGAGT